VQLSEYIMTATRTKGLALKSQWLLCVPSMATVCTVKFNISEER